MAARLLENSSVEDFCRSSIRYTSDRNKDKAAMQSNTVNDSYP